MVPIIPIITVAIIFIMLLFVPLIVQAVIMQKCSGRILAIITGKSKDTEFVLLKKDTCSVPVG